ncbi:MAG TPA: acyl-CoA thioesterase [Longimicrobium sp.]|nr:acyl-CoA thioesterase [Longimicrobium sp.]
MATSADAFEIPVSILPGDVDGAGHVNNVVYVRWVQEVAIAHWLALAPDHVRGAVGWVVLRHEVDYRRPAMPGDSVRARTWVGREDGVRVERHTEIVRERDGAVLARARTIWCPLATTTRRLLRVTGELRALFASEPAAEPLLPRER